MSVEFVEGDLLEQSTEAIVNAWNQNIIPWWLLLPHGVSGAIKKRAGIGPFVEVARFGPLKVGQAVHTSAGKLPYKAIIHVAGINMFWTATEKSITTSTLNAIKLGEDLGLKSIAFPILGAGAGGFNPERAEEIMLDAIGKSEAKIEITIVRFKKK